MAGSIDEFMARKAEEGLLRKLLPISDRKNGKITFDGKEFIDLSSNDYLGLSNHPKLIEASCAALEKFGTSSSASRLLSGDLEIHHLLEAKTAKLKNKDSALVFNSGYQANVGIISSLYGDGDLVLSDRLNHASIIDGILLSRAKLLRFEHNDLNHLEDTLKRERSSFKKALIVTETIFSMDGDRPDLAGLVDLKERYDCEVMVDEAHATGIFGGRGSGIVEEEGLAERIDLIMGTFSKALGSFGAYLAASESIVDYLINTCRSFIYTTALPPAVIACNLAGLELVKEEPHRRIELLRRASYFRDGLHKRGFRIRGSSQIVPLIIGDNFKTKKLAEALQDRGWWASPIRPPTVPKNEARIRFSLTYYHDEETLKRLIDDIAEIGI